MIYENAGRDPAPQITLWDIASMISGVNDVLSDILELYELQSKHLQLLTYGYDQLHKDLNKRSKKK